MHQGAACGRKPSSQSDSAAPSKGRHLNAAVARRQSRQDKTRQDSVGSEEPHQDNGHWVERPAQVCGALCDLLADGVGA